MKKLKEKIKVSEQPIIINISKLSIECCRELKYLMRVNRKEISDVINNWWDLLPEAKDKRFVKRLFGMDCSPSYTMGIPFVGVGIKGNNIFENIQKGLLMFWR